MQNINLEHYLHSTGAEGFAKRLKKYPKNKIGYVFFRINNIIRSFIITGFKYVPNVHVKGGKTWNDNYHLFSKLCRYETYSNVKITQWDKIRFRIITGYKFVS